MIDGTTVLAAQDDGQLLTLVRAGHEAAFGELFARHAGAVRGYAMRCCTDTADAEDMAAEAFFRVFQAVRRGAGPHDNVRGYLLTVVRRLAAEWSARRRDVPMADDELGRQVDAGHVAPASRADLQMIVAAFSTLPSRWRSVLWRVEVEGERPAVVGPHFGLSANATAALARRARQGLRAAYLQAHLAPTGGANGCRSVVAKLGGFTAEQVTGAEAARISEHLADCASCRALHAELRDVCDGLRRYAGSITPPLGGALGMHHALAGHLAWVGARLKLVVAAVSMAAVGGAGVLAGPLLTHIAPAPDADRGVVVGPAPVASAQVVAPELHRMAGAFEPTTTPPRAPTERGHREHTIVAPMAATTPLISTSPAASSPATPELPVPDVQPAGAMTPVLTPVMTTTPTTPTTLSMQVLQAGPPSTTTDPTATTDPPTGRSLPADTSEPSAVPSGP
ncbi:MAG TPA: sigma-70 family RNA polymerase sigma factor [Pseudonocardiaceae bacterium]|nr:sigma-70 family RNA polymerase sigma factor [Pseudonocardiaceae bacterium]